jgi:small-conductance mechanosensitive channel
MSLDLNAVLADKYGYAAILLVAGVVAALMARLFLYRVLHLLTSRTTSDVDDQLGRALRQPVVWTLVLLGVIWSVQALELAELIEYWVAGVLKTVMVVMWSVAAARVGTVLLGVLARRVDRVPLVQAETLPLFEMVKKLTVAAGFVYFLLSAWQLNLTPWLASAGVAGIALGFAAKDTLANLFAGVFIVADAPYKVGDYIHLDGELRGKVTHIGIRSTRMLTRDDIEVTVPNAVVANARIVNESAGPHEMLRVRVKIGGAYGSDVDEVERVLLGACDGVGELAVDPEPRVRMRAFGESSLDFELLAWATEPEVRGRAVHELNKRVYKALNAAGIVIPFPQRDVHVKEMPGQDQ